MKARTLLMGIDNGGTVTKAALYDTSGREVAVASEKTEMLFPHPGHTEKNVDALWAANVRVISEVMKRAGAAPAEVAALAVTGHGNGMYLVAADGSPAHNGINSADSRAADYVARWYADGTFERILPHTCQSIWAAQPAALLAWFTDHDPAALERTRWIFMCKDYVRYRLTGEVFAEVTDYSGLNLVDVRTLCYDESVLAAFGISHVRDKLPPLRRSGEICGRITARAAAETGLAEGTPVAGGLFDITACAIGPASRARTGSASSPAPGASTSTSARPGAGPRPLHDLEILHSRVLAHHRGQRHIREQPGVGRLRADAGRAPRGPGCRGFGVRYRQRDGAGRGPEDSDVLFLPFLYGSNVGPKASAGFLGLHGWQGKAHMLRAVFEGVVFSHKTHIDRLLGYRDRAQAARIAGGAAKSDVWVQMFADVLQLPIECTACEELGAMGAAMCAGVGVGIFGCPRRPRSRW